MLVELEEERQQIDEMIFLLERMAAGPGEATRKTTEVDDRDEETWATTRQQEQAEGWR